MRGYTLHSDVAFNEVVNRDLRNSAEAGELDWLEDNLEDWRAALVKIKISIETQLGKHRSAKQIAYATLNYGELDSWIADRENWKADTLRLKGAVEVRLVDINCAIKTRQSSRQS